MNDTERSSSPNESQFEQWLMKKLHRVTCPDTLELSEYAGGLLSSDRIAMLELHLETCPKCRQELNLLRAFMAEDDLPAADNSQSDSFVDRLQRPFRRLIAIIHESNVPGFAGQMALRGTVGDQLVYEVEDVQIVIDIQSDPANQNLRVIYGLVLGLEAESLVSITLYNSDLQLDSTRLDEIGNFSFEGLAKGIYRIRLWSGSVEVEINELRIVA